MDVGEVVSTYVKSLMDLQSVLPSVADMVKAPANCEALLGSEMLGEKVRMPIRLPVVTGEDVYKTLRGIMPVVFNAIREYAKNRGIEEVVVPYLDKCMVRFKNVKVDSLSIDVFYIEYSRYVSLLAIEIEPTENPVRRFPLAWWVLGNAPAPSDYVDYLSIVYLTALFVNKNPWFVDALKTAIEETTNAYRSTFEGIASFHNALKLLTGGTK